MGRAETLISIIRSKGYRSGAELGVYRGQTFFRLLDACPDLFLIGVDSWGHFNKQIFRDKVTGAASYGPLEPMHDHAQEVMAKALQYGPHRCRIMRMRTDVAHQRVNDRSLDFVFIDADHTTNAVMGDILNWRPKIVRGGMLCGHDADWPAVKSALRQSQVDAQILPGNVWMTLI